MASRVTYLMTRSDVESVLTMQEALEAVEEAFRAYGEGKAQMPPKSYLQFEKGDLRCMPAYLPELGLAGVKNVNVHPQNRDLPAVMATVTLFDPESGFPLAIMDGMYLTAMRTGAAGGIAAKYLARKESRVAGFVGAGTQAETQLAALMITVPGIRRVLVCDTRADRAAAFAEHSRAAYGLEASAVTLAEAVRSADILTTVTPVRKPIVRDEWVRPGTHINAIGADAAGKQELETAILLRAKVVIDDWQQSSHGGEINVAVAEGALSHTDVHAEIGAVVTGQKVGRETDEEITVFDSTGLAVQDVACAARVYRRLMEQQDARSRLRTVDFMAG